MKNTQQIVDGIKQKCLSQGQNGLLTLTEELDKIKLKSLILQIPRDTSIPQNLQSAINTAKDNIFKFHKAEHDKLKAFQNDKIETTSGIFCYKKFTPIDSVGVYIPNNLFSSVLMNIIPAQIAGCKNIVVCTPPNPSSYILYTLNLLGIKQIYTIGGSQAIFALAYGIGEVPKVDKIFGPGNEFVDTAKKMVSNEVAIDMPAGPSEVLIICENTNNYSVIYDLLAQLEHGKQSKAWLFCSQDSTIEFVKQNIAKIAENSPRWHILQTSLNNLIITKVQNIDEAIEKSNKIAPEHLILNIPNAQNFVEKITNAGSVFIGSHTPESLGDYISGTNHVLPTSGFAKAFSGLSVLSFGKFITFQQATQDGLNAVKQAVCDMATAEELHFHAQSINRDKV